MKYISGKLNKSCNDYSKLFNEKQNVKNDQNLDIKFNDIVNLSFKKNISYYENLCRGLLNQKQYDLALEIADNHVRIILMLA